MKRLFLALLAGCIAVIGCVGTAIADEAPAVSQVVIVDLESDGVDDAVMDSFYGDLRTIIDDTESMAVSETGDISMGDLTLMAGCDSPTPECLVMLGDFVDGDMILFGSVDQGLDSLTFDVSLFDFTEGTMVREISESLSSTEDDWIADGIPAIGEHLLFGATASLTVNVDDSDAQIRVNGDSVGTGSATVDELGPGEIVVLIRDSDGAEQQERVIVRHEEQAELDVSFSPAVADIDEPDSVDGPSLVPGLAASGVGVAGVVLGFVAQSQLSSARDDASALRAEDGPWLHSRDDVSAAHDLQSDMDSANTMRFIGFTGGALGLGAGGFLLFRALTADTPAAGSEMGQRSLELDVGASSDGVNAGIRLGF